MKLSSGSCTLIIAGNPDLDFEEINSRLSINPTKKFKCGEIANKIAGPIKNDIWTYEIKISEEPNTSLNKLLMLLVPKKDFITNLSNTVDVSVRCYTQSDLAQIGFTILPDTIKMLADLNIRFDISILSWGQVEME